MKVKIESEVAQSCPTLSDPMDSSLPGSSIYGIFQARVLEWVAIAFSESIFGTTSNLHTFWSQVKVEYLEIAKKNIENPDSISNIICMCSRVFSGDSNQNEVIE